MSKERYYQLAPDLTIRRLVNGMWQVAGGNELAIEDMIRYHEEALLVGTWQIFMARQKILLESLGVKYWH
jgi:hypothetical protein